MSGVSSHVYMGVIAATLDALFLENRGALWAAALESGADASRCDDLVQQSLLIAWERRVSFPNRRAFIAWARRTIRFTAFAENRRRRPEAAAEESSGRVAADDVETVATLCVRVESRNPDEDIQLLACFVLHTFFDFGVRYLAYVAEMPKSTLDRRFDAIRARAAMGDATHSRRAAELLVRVAQGLVREKLMARRERTAREVYAMPRELLLRALAMDGAARTTVLASMAWCISYIFRRCAADAEMARERDSLHAQLTDRRHSFVTAAEYMRVRSLPDARPEDWRAVLDQVEETPTMHGTGVHIMSIEAVHGWGAAHAALRGRVPPSRMRHSFYLNYLAAHYSLKSGQPRIASRHFDGILDFYCPEYFGDHVRERRGVCNDRWRLGGLSFDGPAPLLA